jgi:hypothetical protein
VGEGLDPKPPLFPPPTSTAEATACRPNRIESCPHERREEEKEACRYQT